MKRFENKVVLVTGAASGIGLVTARAFAREGGKVVLADANVDAAARAADDICTVGGQATAIGADVTDPEACKAMVAHAVDRFGGLHVAFNNAGIGSSIASDFEEASLEDWDRIIKVNLSGIFYAMKAEIPAMRASGGCAIVNTASVASIVGAAGMPAYVASKHGVAGLTKAAALDLIRHGIRVNAICPGVIETPMLMNASAAAREAMASVAPIGRLGTPDEIAQAVLFLASDAASYMVGALILADGGLTVG